MIAGAVLLTGCTASITDTSPPTGPSAHPSSRTTTAPPTSDTVTAEQRSTLERRVDALAKDVGLQLLPREQSLYPYPHDYVDDVCHTLRSNAAVTDPNLQISPSRWLDSNITDPDGARARFLTRAFELMPACADFRPALRKVREGTQLPIGDATHTVGEDVQPGTYVLTGDIRQCYWAIHRADGSIRDNQYTQAAEKIEITLRPSDSRFVSQGCGSWEPVS